MGVLLAVVGVDRDGRAVPCVARDRDDAVRAAPLDERL